MTFEYQNIQPLTSWLHKFYLRYFSIIFSMVLINKIETHSHIQNFARVNEEI
jgi:hypothetical protein